MGLPDAEAFVVRQIGPRPADRDAMLAAVGAPSLDALIDEVIPPGIRLDRPLALPDGESEAEVIARLRALAGKNRVARSYLGMGYYGCITPSVILRLMLENPGWYTPYTPYQAEIAQGRLEALLVFQTMVSDLTGLPIANASLLDEATAAAEAMTMMYRLQARQVEAGRRTFLVAKRCFPQTLDVLRTRAEPFGIELRVGELEALAFDGAFGVLVQYPDDHGELVDLREFTARAHEAGLLVAVATDLLALTLVTPPGEFGADIALGNSQRFGVPMGYGGPHAAFFATREAYVRQMPGRLIGVSIDAHGRPAYRMALQTREQHIRREKATSNICTAQALLANMAAMYAVWHGPDGLVRIARRVHGLARTLEAALGRLGVRQTNRHYFDTLRIDLGDPVLVDRLRQAAWRRQMNFRYVAPAHVGIALDETTGLADVQAIADAFAEAVGRPAPRVGELVGGDEARETYPSALRRTSSFLTHPVFHSHRSELQMMRYLRSLERKDIGLDRAMIPLGSCTMKSSPSAAMQPVSWPEFAAIHPFAPADQVEGYREILHELERWLCEITGFAAVSLQPNSGAQGELTGLLVIRAYHRDRGASERRVVLIPASAHGTNPASAAMAGQQVVVVGCDAAGNIDVADLRAKATQYRDRLAALMVTYPSTHGIFEPAIQEICRIVHDHGGQVYMDGANLNAQVGLTSPARIGADLCHLNLHKTFAIPHGGGGPGMGPIAVAAHLAPYLPGHPVVETGGPKAIGAVAAAPYGSALVLLITYAYLRLLGGRGLTEVSKYAILNANYLKARLERHYPVLYVGPNGRVGHELIFDLRPFKQRAPIDERDVAKRLMDYGFHAPTVSFPVPGTLMVEPTESEPKEELDRFCEALIAIRREIQAVVDGQVDPRDNVLKNAPHTAEAVAADAWPHPYSREQAAFPLPGVRADKFWPPVGRIDDPYGDRHLVCRCLPPAHDSLRDDA
jgi:glycine dehydrogenase